MEANGPSAFDRKLPFDEVAILNLNLDFVRREVAALKVTKVDIVRKEGVKEGGDAEDLKKAEGSVPGVPSYRIL